MVFPWVRPLTSFNVKLPPPRKRGNKSPVVAVIPSANLDLAYLHLFYIFLLLIYLLHLFALISPGRQHVYPS